MNLKLTISYKNGNTLEQFVNYVHVEDEKIVFTVNKRVHSAVQEQVRIPLANIKSFDVEMDG